MTESATVDELFDQIVKPLVLGGAFRPLDPIGPARAANIAQQAAQGMSAANASWVTVARVRRARALCPVDTLPELTLSEWLMIVALNDLIRSTDPEVNGLFSPDRAGQIVHGAIEVLAQVPGARTVGEALARHATFAEMMSLQRTDTTVTWWCGSSSFAGRKPPDRLLSWPRVRRVRSQRSTLGLTEMASGSEATRSTFLEGIRALLARTPMTDLATAGRTAPPFAWTSPTVSLLSGSVGRNVALRALRANGKSDVLTAVRKAAETMTPAPSANVRRTVSSVIQELEAWGRAA